MMLKLPFLLSVFPLLAYSLHISDVPTSTINPSLTSSQTKEVWREEALKRAHEGLAKALAEPTKFNGVRPDASAPANIHATLIYATNNACLQKISDCEWNVYPIMNFGGDLPMAPKDVAGDGKIKFMVSCIVCSDKRMCTRPELNVHLITKQVVDNIKKTRVELVNIAKEVSEIEKRCKRTQAPYDQKLEHVRNQHPGISQMYGVPPPVVASKPEEDETN